jgi:hypothetical protein
VPPSFSRSQIHIERMDRKNGTEHARPFRSLRDFTTLTRVAGVVPVQID